MKMWKKITIAVLSSILYLCLICVYCGIEERQANQIESDLEEIVNYDDTGNYELDKLVEEIYKDYGITVELDMSFEEYQAKYKTINNETVNHLNNNYYYTKATDLDENNKIELLVALKDTLALYSKDAIKRLPTTILIRKNETMKGDSRTSGFVYGRDTDHYMMVLYYEPYYSNWWLYTTSYIKTINHEIFHCLDYRTDNDKWNAIDEDCHNIRAYACSNAQEEKAETWTYLLNGETPNPKKAQFLKTHYGLYLKTTSK